MPRQPRLCKNNDGNKHYSKGYCRACYMRHYRAGDLDGTTPEEDIREDIEIPEITVEALDESLRHASARLPSVNLATEPREDDTDGIRTMRARLAGALHLARREIVKVMLQDGYEAWQIKNEFLIKPELYKQFLTTVEDPDRVLSADIEYIKRQGQLDPLARYVDGLRRSLRRANSYAEDTDLSAKERSSWAKTADELQRNIALLEKAIHSVPGRGDLPLGRDLVQEDGVKNQEWDGYELPDVEGDEDDSDSE